MLSEAGKLGPIWVEWLGESMIDGVARANCFAAERPQAGRGRCKKCRQLVAENYSPSNLKDSFIFTR